ncbi:hypothetical protein JXO59_05230 [candidate division KSB1 bacterium]|nr:hypothetical protein [candidate division KSB1 bacterium]
MKRILYLQIIGLCLSVVPLSAETTTPYECSVIEANDGYMIIDVTFDSVVMVQKKTAAGWVTDISMPGCSYTDRENLPKLPATAMILGIPPEGEAQVRVLNEETFSKVIGPVSLVEWPPWEPRTEPVLPLDAMQDVYPQAAVEPGLCGFLRNQRILQIGLYPVRYFTAQGAVQITRKLRLRIDFTGRSAAAPSTLYRANTELDADTAFEEVFKASLINYSQSRIWRASAPSETVLQKEVTTAAAQLRIGVGGDGVYAITGSELEAAGVDLQAILPATLSMTNRGNSVPILVEGGGDGSFDQSDRIIFIGQHNPGDKSYFSPYSDTNAYWLSWNDGPGARFARLSGAGDAGNPDTVRSSPMFLHLEKETSKFERFLSIAEDEIDPWYWWELVNDSEYSVTLPVTNARSDKPLRLRAGFRGSTYLPVSPDHHVQFYFNDEALGSLVWDNQNAAIYDSQFRTVAIRPDQNILKMVTPMDLPGVNVDRVLLDWLEIEYEGQLIARNDSLRFILEAPERVNVRIDGFSSEKIYLFTEEGQIISDPVVKRNGDTYSCHFSFISAVQTSFYAVGNNRLNHVSSLVLDTPSTLRDRSNSADYIVITHRNFYQQARQLADFRYQQGLRTAVVDIQDIYDEFNHGIYDPRAIRSFLHYAYHNWSKPAPLYILLFGDTTHNMDKKVARILGTPSFVPAMMVFTGSFGATSSDNALVAVNGTDILPDMYIGRLPANTAQEAQNLIQKTLDYEQKSTVSEWRRNLALVYANGSQFETDAEELYQKYTPRRFVTNRLSTNPNSRYFGSTESMASLINQGQTLLNFIGHGGGGVYFDDQLFLTEDVKRLTNKDKYPVILSLTCFVGHFDDDERESLSEALLRTENKGIVAHFGSVARASLLGDHYLNIALFKVLFEQGARKMGEITTLSKIVLISMTNGYWDTVKHFLLLGDPAMNFYMAENTVQIEMPQTDYTDGTTLQVQGQCLSFSDGSVRVGLYNQIDSLIVDKEVPLQNGRFSSDLYTFNSENLGLWPEGSGKGIIRAYANNSYSDGCTAAEITVNAHGSAQALLDPTAPKHQDNVYFVAQFDEDQFDPLGGINSAYIQWSLNKNDFTRIYLSRQSEGIWRSNLTLKNREGTRIFYQLVILSNSGTQYIDEIREYTVGYRPDLLADPLSVRIYGSQGTQIRFTVTNHGDMDSGPFNIKITEGLSASTFKQVSDILSIDRIPARSDTTVEAIWSGNAAGDRRLWFNLDIDGQVDESNEGNNTTMLPVKIVTPAHGSDGPLFSTEGNYYIEIPGESVSATTPLTFGKEWQSIQQKAADLSGLVPLPLRSAVQPLLYRVSFTDTTMVMQKNMTIAGLYDKSDAQIQTYVDENKLRLYGWNDQSSTWNGLVSTVDKTQGLVMATMPSHLRAFALMASEDAQPPMVRFSVSGQNFVDGDIIPAQPVISAYMEDASGFDIAGSQIKLYLDQQQVSEEKIKLFQNDNSRRTMTLTYAPELQPGSHDLILEVKDINGNQASEQVSFKVTGEFGLDILANHPNPFASETTIAFYLTEMASEVKLGIHTVSGRLIRKIVLNDISGYNEVDWDGLDDEGNPVANGVYYLRFTARKGDSKIERVTKMARLQ